MLKGCLKYILILFLNPFAVLSQTDNNEPESPSVIGVRSQYAYVIIHSRDLRPMENTYPFGIGIDIKKRYTSQRTWESFSCYPMVGFSFTYWDFNNPGILGKGFSSLFFVEPFFGYKRKVNASLRAGFGLAFLSNPYDEESNPGNLSYSTHLGFPLLLSLNINYQMKPKFNINAGVYYNHISNGGVKYPNKGINYPSLTLGVDYYFKPAVYTDYRRTDWKADSSKRSRHSIVFLMAMTSIDPNETARYAVLGSAYNFSYRIGRIGALKAGFEWIIDESLRKKISRNSMDVDHQRGGILTGFEFLLGHFRFSQQLGIYVYDPYKKGDAVYQRYEMTYLISEKFIVGFSLKAHRHVADFMDFRFGLSF